MGMPPRITDPRCVSARHRYTTPAASETAPTADAALRELHELIGAGGWRSLPGPQHALIFVHPWPDESVDTLAIQGATEVLAERTNPAGRPVWRHAGELTEVIARLRALPAPNAANAPRLILPVDPADRNL